MQIVFDNCKIDENTQSLWGFSIYLDKYKLLFDTGSNGRVLLQNMKKLSIDIQDIEYIFISHSHWDHIGGLDSLLEINPELILYVPSSLSKHLIEDLKKLSKDVIVCDDKPQHLFKTLYTTGILGTQTPEQSLIIDEDETTLITGCGHFGIENITKIATTFLKKDIDIVMGGFHLLKSDDKDIMDSISKLKQLGVKKAYPTHCSGDRALELYNDFF